MDIPPAIDMNTPNPLVIPLTASTIGDDLPACDNAITYEIQPKRMDSVKDWTSVFVRTNAWGVGSERSETHGHECSQTSWSLPFGVLHISFTMISNRNISSHLGYNPWTRGDKERDIGISTTSSASYPSTYSKRHTTVEAWNPRASTINLLNSSAHFPISSGIAHSTPLPTNLIQALSILSTDPTASMNPVYHIPPTPANTYLPCLTNAIGGLIVVGVSIFFKTFEGAEEGKDGRRLFNVGLDIFYDLSSPRARDCETDGQFECVCARG